MEFDEMYCSNCQHILKLSDGVWYGDDFYCNDCFKIRELIND